MTFHVTWEGNGGKIINQRRLDLQHGSSNTIAPPAPFDLKNPSSDIAYRPNSTTSTDKYNDVLRRRRGKRHCHCSTFAEGNETNYVKVKEKFDQHFIVKRNVIFERAKFNMRTQEPGEPIDIFITDPYGLSEHCEFGAIREELIRDRRGGVTRCKAKRKTPIDSTKSHVSINHKQSEAERVGKKAAGNSSTWSFTSFTRNWRGEREARPTTSRSAV